MLQTCRLQIVHSNGFICNILMLEQRQPVKRVTGTLLKCPFVFLGRILRMLSRTSSSQLYNHDARNLFAHVAWAFDPMA